MGIEDRFQICLDNYQDTKTYMEMVFYRFFPNTLEKYSLAGESTQKELDLAEEVFVGTKCPRDKDVHLK